MNFILKIVRGPNAGAEVALVEGVCVSVGKSDSCDIVLADQTLPDEPLQLEAQPDGVTLTSPGGGREHLKPFHVKTFGSTAFATGPADSAWQPLVEEREKSEAAPGGAENETPEREKAEEKSEEKKEKAGGGSHRSCFGCLTAIVLLLLVLCAVLWFSRDTLRERLESFRGGESGISVKIAQGSGDAPAKGEAAKETYEGLLERLEVVETNRGGRAVLVRNFRTRAERLAAAGDLYAAKPGVELDFSDDESFKAAATDLLFSLTGGDIEVEAATNRVLALAGTSPSPLALKRTLKALSADLPHLDNVVCDKITWSGLPAGEGGDVDPGSGGSWGAAAAPARDVAVLPAFPVCGIVTTPVPCLVLKNGTRILEGASFEGFTVESISADSVTVTNAAGRFSWKP